MKDVTKTDFMRLAERLSVCVKNVEQKGTGDVSGPDGAADGHIAVFDGDGGKTIGDGGKSLSQVIYGDSPDGTKAGAIDPNAITKSGFYYCLPHANCPDASNGHLIHNHLNANSGYALQFFMVAGDSSRLYQRGCVNGAWGSWQRLWHSGNDGSGSGLDADSIDGYQSSVIMLRRGQLPANANFNNYNDMGSWSIGSSASMSNDPGVDWATLVITRGVYYWMQEVFNYNGSARYRRFCNNGTWGAWSTY